MGSYSLTAGLGKELIGTMSLLFVACFFIPATISFFGLARLTWFLAFVAILFTVVASLLVITGEKILKKVFKKRQ